MAENNRNRGRTSNQDWNENRGRGNSRNWDDDRDYSRSENRGYGNSSGRDYDDSGSAGWQSRYQREEYNRGGGYGSGRHGRHMGSNFDSGNYGDRDHGYASYYGGGSSYGAGMGEGFSYGASRGLYDRDYEGAGRRGYSNMGTRIGGSNYGGYNDRDRNQENETRDRDWYESRTRDYNEGRGSGYTGYAGNTGGNFGRTDYGRSSDFRRERDEDRGFWDRASDEVASWFGDEDAERRRDRDRMMKNSHKGKGPRNYSRSDDRIKEDINDRLSDDPFIDASDIDVTVSNGEVTLTGTVDERTSKRRAEDLAESVSGVKNVENRIRVNQTSSYGTGVTGMGTSGTTSRTSTQNRESQSSEHRNPEKDKQSTGTNSKKDFVTG